MKRMMLYIIITITIFMHRILLLMAGFKMNPGLPSGCVIPEAGIRSIVLKLRKQGSESGEITTKPRRTWDVL